MTLEISVNLTANRTYSTYSQPVCQDEQDLYEIPVIKLIVLLMSPVTSLQKKSSINNNIIKNSFFYKCVFISILDRTPTNHIS